MPVESMKVRPAGSQDGAVGGEGDVCDLVGDESVAAQEGLALAACTVEEDEAVGGGDVDGVSGGVGEDAVDAEDVVVFDVRGWPQGIGWAGEGEDVETAVEVADPEAAVGREV